MNRRTTAFPLHNSAARSQTCPLPVLAQDTASDSRALLQWCRKGQEAKALLLLQRDHLSLSLTDNEGNTALHYASQQRLPEVFVVHVRQPCHRPFHVLLTGGGPARPGSTRSAGSRARCSTGSRSTASGRPLGQRPARLLTPVRRSGLCWRSMRDGGMGQGGASTTRSSTPRRRMGQSGAGDSAQRQHENPGPPGGAIHFSCALHQRCLQFLGLRHNVKIGRGIVTAIPQTDSGCSCCAQTLTALSAAAAFVHIPSESLLNKHRWSGRGSSPPPSDPRVQASPHSAQRPFLRPRALLCDVH